MATSLPPGRVPAGRAAALAAACARYRRGGPGRALGLRGVRSARSPDISDVGLKYHLELVLEDTVDNDSTVNCTAEVLYHLGKKNLPPDVQFTIDRELKNTDEADNIFYNRIKSLEKELVAENIPDSHGNVSPEMEPIHLLAWAASGYVVWQNSTENTNFQLAQIKQVKQVKRDDEYLEFDYMILLHEMVSQALLGNGRDSIHWSFTALSSWEILLPNWPGINGEAAASILDCLTPFQLELQSASTLADSSGGPVHRGIIYPSSSPKNAAGALGPGTLLTLHSILHPNSVIRANVFIRKMQKN